VHLNALILSCHNQYNVLSHFVEGIISDLKSMGISSEEYSMSTEDKDELNNKGSYLKKFDFCLSINAVGLDLDFQGQGTFTDVTGKPTLVLVVDHPIHFFKRFYGKNVILLCVDQEHVAFVNLVGHQAQYFPHAVAKQSGSEPNLIPLQDKSSEIIFPATYFPIKKWRDLLDPLWGQIGEAVENAKSVTRFMQFVGILPYGNRAPSIAIDEAIINTCIAVDFYLRGKYRLATLKLYEEAGINLTVIGNGSHQYHTEFPGHHYQPAMDIEALLIRIQNAKFVVHNSPGFERGLHDRIVIPMNMGTAVIGHDTPFANEEFKKPGGILTKIDKKTLEVADEDYEQMCLSNYQQLQQSHTWQHRFKLLFGR
jgi:hypothetical protein